MAACIFCKIIKGAPDLLQLQQRDGCQDEAGAPSRASG
jgi:hypothetical protein